MRQRRLARARIEYRHDIPVAADGTDRKAAADDFSERGQIGIDVPDALRTAKAEAERDDLVEDQERADLARDLSQRLEIGLIGRREARAVRHGIDQHAGKPLAVLADQADCGFGVVEGNGDDVGEHIVRRALRIGDRKRRVAAPYFRCWIQADLGIVIGAVIGALAFGDFWTAGMRPRRFQRYHHGLGAGIGKAYLVDRGQARDQQFSEIDLGFRRQAERRSQRELRGRRLDQRGMRVAVNLRGEIVDAVDIDVAVEIPDPAALAARGVDRIGLHEHGGAGVAAG